MNLTQQNKVVKEQFTEVMRQKPPRIHWRAFRNGVRYYITLNGKVIASDGFFADYHTANKAALAKRLEIMNNMIEKQTTEKLREY